MLQEGWDQWKWASDVFPELSDEATHTGEASGVGGDDNPFAGLAFGGDDDGGGAGPASEDVNPFASPSSSHHEEEDYYEDEPGGVTPKTKFALRDTRPWVLFLSILGFINAAGLLLGGLGALLSFMLVSPVMGLLVGLTIMGSGLLSAIGPYFLFMYSVRIKEFVHTEQVGALEEALVAQKSFWKFTGGTVLAVMALYFLMFIIMFAAGGLAMLGGMAGR